MNAEDDLTFRESAITMLSCFPEQLLLAVYVTGPHGAKWTAGPAEPPRLLLSQDFLIAWPATSVHGWFRPVVRICQLGVVQA